MFLKSLRENLAGYLCSKMGEKSKKKKKERKTAEDKADILFAAASAKYTKYIP